MLDPLFTLTFMVIVVIPIAAVVFAVVRKHRTVGLALLLALAVPIVGLVGFSGSTMLQINFNPYFLDEPPVVRVGVSLIAAVLAAWVTGYLMWRATAKKLP